MDLEDSTRFNLLALRGVLVVAASMSFTPSIGSLVGHLVTNR